MVLRRPPQLNGYAPQSGLTLKPPDLGTFPPEWSYAVPPRPWGVSPRLVLRCTPRREAEGAAPCSIIFGDASRPSRCSATVPNPRDRSPRRRDRRLSARLVRVDSPGFGLIISIFSSISLDSADPGAPPFEPALPRPSPALPRSSPALPRSSPALRRPSVGLPRSSPRSDGRASGSPGRAPGSDGQAPGSDGRAPGSPDPPVSGLITSNFSPTSLDSADPPRRPAETSATSGEPGADRRTADPARGARRAQDRIKSRE